MMSPRLRGGSFFSNHLTNVPIIINFWICLFAFLPWKTCVLQKRWLRVYTSKWIPWKHIENLPRMTTGLAVSLRQWVNNQPQPTVTSWRNNGLGWKQGLPQSRKDLHIKGRTSKVNTRVFCFKETLINPNFLSKKFLGQGPLSLIFPWRHSRKSSNVFGDARFSILPKSNQICPNLNHFCPTFTQMCPNLINYAPKQIC